MSSYRLRHDSAMRDVALDICTLVLPWSLLNWVSSDMDQFAKTLPKSAWVSKMRLALDATLVPSLETVFAAESGDGDWLLHQFDGRQFARIWP